MSTVTRIIPWYAIWNAKQNKEPQNKAHNCKGISIYLEMEGARGFGGEGGHFNTFDEK